MFETLNRLFKKQPEPIITQVPIAGLKYYRAVELSDLMRSGDELTFSHEADNEHDPDAVVIFWNRNKIGYIPSSHAKQIRNLMDKYQMILGKIKHIDPEAGESRWVTLNIYPKSTMKT